MALFTPEDSIDARLQKTYHPMEPEWAKAKRVQSGQWDKEKAM